MYLIISKIRTAPYQLCPLENRCVLLLRKHKRNDCTAKVQNKLELEKETRRNLKYFSKKFGAYRNSTKDLFWCKKLLLAHQKVSFCNTKTKVSPCEKLLIDKPKVAFWQ